MPRGSPVVCRRCCRIVQLSISQLKSNSPSIPTSTRRNILYKSHCSQTNDIHISRVIRTVKSKIEEALQKMRVLLISLAVLCAIACTVEAQRSSPGQIRPPPPPKLNWPRFRRDAPEEEPQGWPQGKLRRVPPPKLNWGRFRRDAPEEEPQGWPQGKLRQPPPPKFNWPRFRRDAPEDEPQGWPQGKLRQPPPPKFNWPRFRRDAPEEPQGSVVVQGSQPLSGPDRNPTLDLNYQHRLIDNDRTKLDAFGGANLHNGRVTPQAGFGVEHRFKNDIFVHGGGQVQPGPRGRLEPSFGAGVGWRFRRDAPEEPQGSIVVQGSKPLSGPDRNPTLDLNYQQRIIDNDRTKLDAFGGANLHNGRVSPQAGFGVEHRFKNDIFLHGGGQVQQGPRGRFEPSFGAGIGYRFRREAQPYEEEEEEVY